MQRAFKVNKKNFLFFLKGFNSSNENDFFWKVGVRF